MTYLDGIAEAIRAAVPRDVGIPEDTDDLFRLYAVLARASGETVTAREVHDAWVAWMQSRGERHESMIPFEQLDQEIRAEDQPFVAAIRQVVRQQRST
jgi:hypothetical protein